MSSVVEPREGSLVPDGATGLDHRVRFYENDDSLARSLSHFVLDGLRNGEGCVVIATEPHRRAIERSARSAGLDLGSSAALGQYLALDAEETLAAFMGEAMPRADAFSAIAGSALRRVGAGRRRVRAFGEMVAILWAAGNRSAAIRLEELWNELSARYLFSLSCAYPMGAFPRESDGEAVRQICDRHARVEPAESYSELAEPADRLRAVVQLQQRAASLEAEISQRHEVEKKLSRQERELSDFLENAAEGVHRVGPDGVILWANKAELELLGWSAEEYVGHPIAEFHTDPDAIREILRRLLAGETLRDCPATLRCKDGSVKHVRIHSNGFWENGRFVYSRCFTRDVSDRKRLEDELKRRVDALADQDRRKDEFLATLAHELRNPLAPLRMSVRLIRAHPDATETARHLDVIDRQAASLARIVDDLLDVSRVTTGKIELRREPLDVMTAVARAVDAARPIVEQNRHDLLVSLPRGTVFVLADPVRLEQIIVNLLINSAKYTPAGGSIRIAVERTGETAEIRVRDNGIGIPGEMLEGIFDLFRQGSHEASRSSGGLGIGLTITRRLVELHGGTIHASSDGPGRGSEFVVRLPAAAGRPSAGKVDGPILALPSDEPLRILIVDDNVDAGEALAEILLDDGHHVRVAFRGETALEAAAEFEPQLVLLDLGLPGIDGFEVARRLRGAATDARLVAVTGYGQKADQEATAAAGFDDHLVKPVKLDRLARVIEKARDAARPAASSSDSLGPRPA